MNRREMLLSAPLALMAPVALLQDRRPRPGRRRRVSRPPFRRPRPHQQRRRDPELKALALAYGAAIDAVIPHVAAFCDPKRFPEAWEERVWEPLIDEFEASEERLLEAMRERGLDSIEVRGRIYSDLCGTDNGAVPEVSSMSVVSKRSAIRLD
jgi:hypothetical protein